MHRVLIAGLLDELGKWLEKRLPEVSVEVAHDGKETLAKLAQGDWALLVIDDSLTGPAAMDVLHHVREQLHLTELPILFCLDKTEENDLQSTLVDDLGVRQWVYHPLNRDELAREAAAALSLSLSPVETGGNAARQTLAAVAGVWERFKDPILARVTVLERATTALLANALDDDLRQQAGREAHKLAGSVGTFGFPEGSRLAREAEQLLQLGGPLRQAEAQRLSELVVALRRELQRTPAEPARSLSPAPEGQPLLLIVDDDEELAQRLALEALAHGLRVEVAASPAAARAILSRSRPDIVLLDLSFGNEKEDGLTLLAELGAAAPPILTLVFTVRGTFTDRVEVARLGGRGFLEKPLAPAQVMESVFQSLEHVRPPSTKVLAVDDDPEVLAALQATLEPQGLKLITLGDPSRFWETLQETAPELLILDVDMPVVSGIDLCQVIRNDSRWSNLPVVFLTGHTDSETIQRIFAVGADDYVAKPFVGPELLVRVRNRLDRGKLLRAMADVDYLTGLTNRRRSLEVLGQFLRLASRHKQQMALAILDIDHFKDVNDRYGHATGDMVLRRLAELLTAAFRGDDVVARWGGEEFVLGMYGMTKHDGVQRLAEVLEALRGEEFNGADGQHFRVQFSGGVADYPDDGADVQLLYRAADAALYQAKTAGRGRVLPAGWTPPRSEAQMVDVVLVDDDEALAGLISAALETRGYQHQWIKDGWSAVETLGGPSPALTARVVLLDLGLPDLDGLAVLKRLVLHIDPARTRIIVFTARSTGDDVRESLRLGASDYVAKPVTIPALTQRLRRALEAERA
ncbi:MAG: response regulator [Symbiobacteriia bacterium]